MGEPIQVGSPPPDSRRRVLLLAGGAALLILVVLVLPGLLFGGGGGDTDESTPFVVPTGPTTPVGPAPGTVTETVGAFTAKNPFEPLLDLTSGSGDTGPETSDPGTTVTTVVLPPDSFPVVETPLPADPAFEDGGNVDGSEGTVDGGEGTVDGGTTSTTAPAGPPPRQPDRVALLEVFTDPGGQVVASIRINDVVHQVAEGNDFATSYRVVSLDLRTRCAQLLFGDERFGLCEGDETLK